MKVRFLRDIFNAGTKIYEAGKEYDGDLARYVRRGDAVEVKDDHVHESPKGRHVKVGRGGGGGGGI